MQRILSATKTLSTIYDDFNYMVNQDRDIYKKERMNLSAFLAERVEYFGDIAAANGIALQAEIEAGVVLQFNPIEMQRVVDNTLSNAIKYSDEETTVTLRLLKKGKEVWISVEDQGVGIDAPEKVFERYYREYGPKGGFGIGLTIVKGICDKNGVTIDLVSRKGEGTTFTYKIPAGTKENG